MPNVIETAAPTGLSVSGRRSVGLGLAVGFRRVRKSQPDGRFSPVTPSSSALRKSPRRVGAVSFALGRNIRNEYGRPDGPDEPDGTPVPTGCVPHRDPEPQWSPLSWPRSCPSGAPRVARRPVGSWCTAPTKTHAISPRRGHRLGPDRYARGTPPRGVRAGLGAAGRRRVPYPTVGGSATRYRGHQPLPRPSPRVLSRPQASPAARSSAPVSAPPAGRAT
jgi:hypothetical protein